MAEDALSRVFFDVIEVADLRVTCQRVQRFLLLEELPEGQLETGTKLRPKPQDCSVDIKHLTAKWDETLEQDTLHNINATVKAGKLLAVIGPVGAGKSSLLMSVLRELPPMEGSIDVKGQVAYVSQQPWVFSASLRQNVTFGNLFQKAKYDKVLKACALNKDIDLMPHGDVTLIGDRGVSLSGGQRARVSLARALYMEADVYLLDDPLSAVDAAVGRHIFENVIQGVLKDKPRILVTHQLQFLKAADQILILKEGEMIGTGTFDELSTSGVDFASLLKRDKEEEEVKKKPDFAHQFSHHSATSHHSAGTRPRFDSVRSAESKDNIGSVQSLTSIGTEFEAEAVQLPEEEERHEGTVGYGVYVKYFAAGAGILKFLLLTFLCLAAQGAYILSDWWLAYWSNQEEDRFAKTELDNQLRNEGYNVTNVTIPYVDTHFNVYIFTGIIGSVFLFGLLRALMFFKVAVDASQQLHNDMFKCLIRTHIKFFDTNPVGRVLNRFAKDVGHMDDSLPITFFDFIQCMLLILGSVMVAGVVNPWVFIPTVPLCILLVVIRRYYIRTARHIKRLEGTTRSPVFSHLSASLQGLQTIRAFAVQDKFIEEFDNHQNLHTETWFLFLSTSRWLAIRLDWLCAIFVTAVSMCCVLASGGLNAGLVGLSMTYAMTLMGLFQWGVRQSAEVENQMISVERVLDYSNLPSEAPLEADEKHKPASDWPQHGVITTDRASLRYGEDLPLVLKEISFTIKAREKVGIVGRTGAGKSSLITMLFRLVEPMGKITIDDVNIQDIGLHDLRNKISIIPQDPVLFTGTLRRNLDPFGTHADIALWNALTEVQLKSAIEDLPNGLETEVSEGGINFSVGQRQLICLARAILKHNKILMIDEATANVDPRTDALIQQTIRDKFRYCTVLTIAHRLNTIMDSDRLLILDDGMIIDFDAPHILLQKTSGLFYKMVEQTGKTEMDHLKDIAKTAYERSQHGDSAQTIEPAEMKINGNLPHGATNVIDKVEPEDVDLHIEEDEKASLLKKEEMVEVQAKHRSSSESSSSSDSSKSDGSPQGTHKKLVKQEGVDRDVEKEEQEADVAEDQREEVAAADSISEDGEDRKLLEHDGKDDKDLASEDKITAEKDEDEDADAEADEKQGLLRHQETENR